MVNTSIYANKICRKEQVRINSHSMEAMNG